MLLGQPPQPRGGELERLVPADPLPARVGIALRARPFEWVEQPVGVVDQLRRRSPLGAQRLAGWVRWIRLQGNETAVLDAGDRATPRDTQRAVALNPLDGSLGGHDGTLPSTDCCASTPASSARTQGSRSLARAGSARLGIGQRQADSRTLTLSTAGLACQRNGPTEAVHQAPQVALASVPPTHVGDRSTLRTSSVASRRTARPGTV